MESKKKKKIIITISLVSIMLIGLVIGTFFVVKNINNKKNTNNQNASNVSSSIENKLLQANIDIIEGKIPANYAGDYKFKYISSLTFNEKLSHEQIVNIANQNGTSDPNGLARIIEKNKTSEAKSTNEVISLKSNGVYTKSSTTSIEKGEFVGNDDLAEVRVYKRDEELLKVPEKYEMSLTCLKEEMISSNQAVDSNPDRTLLYIYKDFYNTDGDIILFSVTYVYEMQEDKTPAISDEKIKINLQIKGE